MMMMMIMMTICNKICDYCVIDLMLNLGTVLSSVNFSDCTGYETPLVLFMSCHGGLVCTSLNCSSWNGVSKLVF